MRIGILVLAMLLWLGAVPVQAQQTTSADQPAQSTPADQPAQTICKVGAYLSDLYGIDTLKDRIGADFWVWSVCTGEKDALKSAEWLNSEQQVDSLEYQFPTNSGLWSNRKISGAYRQAFDVRNYPFDRHTLHISVEDSLDDATKLTYVGDVGGSKVSSNLRVKDWDITRFAVETRKEPYTTAFGDPALAGDQQQFYPHLDIVIDIKRSSVLTFWKLVAPLYLASVLTLMTFLLHERKGEYIGPRLALQGAILFAIVINMRAVEEVVGETNGLSLMDNLHLLALGLALLPIMSATVWSYLTRKGFDAEQARKWEGWFFLVAGGLYIAANVALIYAAMQAG
jgi:hypothetical protein